MRRGAGDFDEATVFWATSLPPRLHAYSSLVAYRVVVMFACNERGPTETDTSAPSRIDAAETRATDLAFALHIYDMALGMVTRNTTLARA